MKRHSPSLVRHFQFVSITLLIFSILSCASPFPTPTPTALSQCSIFPEDNIWNRDISQLSVDPRSDQYIASMMSVENGTKLHPDFGHDSVTSGGIFFNTVRDNQVSVPVSFTWSDESDPGPYPIPVPLKEEAHNGVYQDILIVNTQSCKLYEISNAQKLPDGSWHADSGAIWDLTKDALRPKDRTSADGAGLPIFPGLVKYDEVLHGSIAHALRFTTKQPQNAYIWPARHKIGSASDPNLPPMGIRLRLKASVNISSYAPQVQTILTALKRYGMMLADQGANWGITGETNSNWDDGVLSQLKTIPGSDFEVVDTSRLNVDENSGQTR
jgi:hypothetical protein